MKRIILWFLSTLTVVVMLFGYRTSTSGPDTAAAPTAIVSSATSSKAPKASATANATSGGRSGGSGASGGTGSGGSSAGGAPSGSSTNVQQTSTVTGSTVETQWGPVQVQLTMKAGRIAKVAVLQYPDGNPRDAEINSYALPQLIQETLSAQSADIDMISGATVTSDGYVRSLQSALDKAGL